MGVNHNLGKKSRKNYLYRLKLAISAWQRNPNKTVKFLANRYKISPTAISSHISKTLHNEFGL